MQSYSQDLRDRVLGALARGEGPSAIARRFEVSRFYVYQVRDREQETGVRSSFQIGGHRRSRLQAAESALRGWIAAEPGLTLAELQERLASKGISTRIGALWHQLNKWNLTFKKNPARQRARTRGRASSATGMGGSAAGDGRCKAGIHR
jgi:transposase